MNWLQRLFRREEPKALPFPERTPEQLEAYIDYVGRDAVFAKARELGWSPDHSPPQWAWGQIAAQVERERGHGATRH